MALCARSAANAKSPPSSSPLRSLELKPLSAPTAPWADIVDDDFELLEEPAPEVVPPEVPKADVEEDDGLGEWGRRRRSMSNEKPMAVLQKVEQALDASTPSEGSERQAEATSEDTGLLKRLLSVEDLQDRLKRLKKWVLESSRASPKELNKPI